MYIDIFMSYIRIKILHACFLLGQDQKYLQICAHSIAVCFKKSYE